MYLKDLVNLIYETSKGSGAEETVYTIKTHHTGNILFTEKAKNIKNIKKDNWIVVEVLIDYSDNNNIDINKNKIITVC